MGFMSKFALFAASRTAKAAAQAGVAPPATVQDQAPAGVSSERPLAVPAHLRSTVVPVQTPNAGQPLPAATGLPPAAAASEHPPRPASAAGLETDLTELLVAIKEQVDAERRRIREGKVSPAAAASITGDPAAAEPTKLMASSRPSPTHGGAPSPDAMAGISQAIESFNRECRHRTLSDDSHVNRLRNALQEITQSMEAMVSELPDPAVTGAGWDAILLDLEGLAEKQRRIDEIQKAFDATMREVEEGFLGIQRHIQDSIRQERDCIDTLQKRIKIAEGLSRLLER
jgi:hypothetical protein